MYKRCGTIYPYLAILATGWWLMTVDVTAALSRAL